MAPQEREQHAPAVDHTLATLATLPSPPSPDKPSPSPRQANLLIPFFNTLTEDARIQIYRRVFRIYGPPTVQIFASNLVVGTNFYADKLAFLTSTCHRIYTEARQPFINLLTLHCHDPARPNPASILPFFLARINHITFQPYPDPASVPGALAPVPAPLALPFSDLQALRTLTFDCTQPPHGALALPTHQIPKSLYRIRVLCDDDDDDDDDNDDNGNDDNGNDDDDNDKDEDDAAAVNTKLATWARQQAFHQVKEAMEAVDRKVEVRVKTRVRTEAGDRVIEVVFDAKGKRVEE